MTGSARLAHLSDSESENAVERFYEVKFIMNSPQRVPRQLYVRLINVLSLYMVFVVVPANSSESVMSFSRRLRVIY